MYEFKLPDIGEGLHEAELLAWDVKVGETIAEGDSVAQISTDKVNVELPSPCSGVVKELRWQPGDVIPVGEVLIRIDDGKGETRAAEGEGASRPAEAASHGGRPERRRVIAAPAVRRYAAEHKVDLALVAPSGENGRVMKQDVDGYIAQSAGAAPGEAVPAGREGVTRFRLSGPRLAAARRIEESARTLATSAMTFEVAADVLLEAFEEMSEEAEKRSVKATPLAVIASCLCKALQQHPRFNAVIDEKDRALEVYEAVHLGTAVDTPEGLLVPVIRDAHRMSAVELARSIAETTERARSGKLAAADLRGSTFTISSTGGLEKATITATTPVINFPNVATLWVSRIRQRPRVIDGSLGAGPMMSCTLAFDHRFIHGADATAFINTLDEKFRNPGLNGGG